jgi:hypothetical protein
MSSVNSSDNNSITIKDNTVHKVSNSNTSNSNTSNSNTSSDYSSDYQDKKQQYVYNKIKKHYPNALSSSNSEILPSTYKNCILRAFHKNNTTNLIDGYIDKHGVYHQLLKPIEDKDVLIKIQDPLNKLKDIKTKHVVDETTQDKLEHYINSKMRPKNKDVSILYNHHDNCFIPVHKNLKRKEMIHVLLLIKHYKIQHTTLYKIFRRKSVKKIKLPSKIKLPLLSKKSPIRKEPTEESSVEQSVEPSEEVSIEPTEISLEPTEISLEPTDEKPVEEPVAKPVEEPVAKPVEEPVAKPKIKVPTELPVVKKISIKKKYRILKDKNGKVIGRLI